MNPFQVFGTLQTELPVQGTLKNFQTKMETEVSFEDNPPKNWKYRGQGKLFNGTFRGNHFLLIQRPFSGTRFGTVVQGSFAPESGQTESVQIKAWVDPRAKRKLIFGYFLSIIVIGRMIRDYATGTLVMNSENILPYIVLAALPMTLFAHVLYYQSLKEGFQRVKSLFISQS